MLTIVDAAKYFPGLNSSAIRRLLRSGEIPCRKIGVKYLVRPEEIENWIRGDNNEQITEGVQ